VVVATTPFAALAHSVADAFGLPDARIVVVEHPLGGTDAETIERRGEGAADAVRALVIVDD
jgi:hypothetical protein